MSKQPRPGVGAFPHHAVAEVLCNGVTDELGPAGYGPPSPITAELVRAGLLEIASDDARPDLWRGRRTRRGRDWVLRHVGPHALS